MHMRALTFFFTNTADNFIRILIECYVYFSPENIALNKTAWQTFTHGHFGADLAVDGIKSNLSECAAFGYDHKEAEWRVDLGGISNIHNISIQYATGNLKWGAIKLFL